jgi:hypothetical protein
MAVVLPPINPLGLETGNQGPFEEEDSPSEDIAALHFKRIQAIPILSDADKERDHGLGGGCEG